MVIDVFYYNNEKEVLETRIALLKDFVDIFVLCEAPLTFSGVQKPLYFTERSDVNIIQHIAEPTKELEKMALLSPNTGNGEHYWMREFIQKESVRYTLEKLCKDDDFVYISDVDEIWNPKMALDMTKDVVYKPVQLPYLYFFNQRTDENWLGWTGTTACKYTFIKNGVINHVRTDGMQDYEVVEGGGWHFNAIGGKKKKVDAFAHPVYYDDGVWRNREINMRKDESDLPEIIINNKNVWPSLYL